MKPHPTPNNHRPARPFMGFTLIELLVVVFIIGILGSVVAPLLSSAVSSKRKAALKNEMQHAEKRGVVTAAREDLPEIDLARLDLALESSYHRLGLEVYTRYLLSCDGELTFRPAPGSDGKVRLAIPFPPLTTEAWDVSLLFRRGDKTEEPTGVRYDQSGIFWEGEMAEGEPVTAEVTFVAVGRERFEYQLPHSSRLRSLEVALGWEGTPSRLIPDYSLQPTGVSDAGASWEFDNLVSDRDIVLELPGLSSASGRLLGLLRFSALSVLLFGAGFWYMSEQVFPGRLDRFRWSHFLVLALVYSLFFIAFAVIVSKGEFGLGVALPAALLASLPLLVVHIARITDWNFSLTRGLPLALASLAVVVNGVYGAAVRDYVFLVLLVAAVGYLTLTLRVVGISPKREPLPA